MSGGGGRTVSRSGRPICAAGDSVLRLGKKWILPMRWVGEVERWRGGEADGESQRTAHLCRWGFGFAAGKKVDFTNEMGGRGGEVEGWRGGR